MMAGRGVGLTAAGGPARHIPVMLSEVIEALDPATANISSMGRSAPEAIRAGSSKLHAAAFSPLTAILTPQNSHKRSKSVSPDA